MPIATAVFIGRFYFGSLVLLALAAATPATPEIIAGHILN
jgi:hypothetical protein